MSMMCILWSMRRYMRAYPLYTHYIYYNNNLTKWKLVKASKFEVHSYYEALMGRGKFSIEKHLATQGSYRCCFLCMDSSTRQNFIVNNLWKRDMMIVNWYCMCKTDGCHGTPFTSW